MSQRTNEADIAAVTEVVRAYYDGMFEADAAKLGRAFHPRASIVGNEGGDLYWANLEEFVAECQGARLRGGALRMANRTPLVRGRHGPRSGSATSSRACGTATTCLSSGSTTPGASSTKRSTHTPRVEGELRNDPAYPGAFSAISTALAVAGDYGVTVDSGASGTMAPVPDSRSRVRGGQPVRADRG